MDRQERIENFTWYTSNLSLLYKQYGNNFVAIKDKAVFSSGKTFKEVLTNALQTYKLGAFIVQQCGPDSSVYTNTISSTNFLVNEYRERS